MRVVDTWDGDAPPSVEQVLRRIAFHIRQRIAEPGVAERVAARARITRKTLSRYAAVEALPTSTTDPRAAGPRRLDLFIAICRALDENPGKVLWAATLAADYPAMRTLLEADVHLHRELRIMAGPGGPRSLALQLVQRAPGDD
ncbi:hypothetical protein ACO2Q0_20650 [Phenylobacterium sp. VNQ135]|uniref:hypothetical protein n=1 Tax=Phenylobacterium sp. VNQ135 TaxID=3400922 RepID=UPI003C10E5B3